jgi:hypothetical protein
MSLLLMTVRATLAAPVEAFDIPVFPPFLNIYDGIQ